MTRLAITTLLLLGIASASAAECYGPNRHYTVQEIDALRDAVDNKYKFGEYSLRKLMRDYPNGWQGRPYYEAEKTKAVEEQVRTLMLAGCTAEDLFASEEKK